MFRERSDLYIDPRFAETLLLRTQALDDVVAAHFVDQLQDGCCDLLKADVQGAEIAVLLGGLRTLSQAKLVLLEAPVLPYNEGAPRFSELIAFMASQGFEVVDVADATYAEGVSRVLHLDLLFAPRFSRLLRLPLPGGILPSRKNKKWTQFRFWHSVGEERYLQIHFLVSVQSILWHRIRCISTAAIEYILCPLHYLSLFQMCQEQRRTAPGYSQGPGAGWSGAQPGAHGWLTVTQLTSQLTEALRRLYRDPQVFGATQDATWCNMQTIGPLGLDSFGVMLGDEHFWLPSSEIFWNNYSRLHLYHLSAKHLVFLPIEPKQNCTAAVRRDEERASSLPWTNGGTAYPQEDDQGHRGWFWDASECYGNQDCTVLP